jgi:hypothetical protein
MQAAAQLVLIPCLLLMDAALGSAPAGAGEMPGNEALFSPQPSAKPWEACPLPQPAAPDFWLKQPVVAELHPSSPEIDGSEKWVQPAGVEGSFSQKMNDFWGEISSRLEVHDREDRDEYPLAARKCQTEEALRMAVTGPVFVFGQLGTNCPSLDSQDLQLTGRTGLGWKGNLASPLEVVLRGGPCVTCDDVSRPVRFKKESDVFVELLCRYPLPGSVNLEYQSTALPALNVTEHDRISQDLRVAFPLGRLGQFRIGAKHSWDSATMPRLWTDGMQVYLGVDLKP